MRNANYSRRHRCLACLHASQQLWRSHVLFTVPIPRYDRGTAKHLNELLALSLYHSRQRYEKSKHNKYNYNEKKSFIAQFREKININIESLVPGLPFSEYILYNTRVLNNNATAWKRKKSHRAASSWNLSSTIQHSITSKHKNEDWNNMLCHSLNRCKTINWY